MFNPKKLSIQALWEGFETQMVNPQASAAQRRALKIAFFGGAHALMAVNKRLGEEDISEEDGCKVLQLLDDELDEFFRNDEEPTQ